MLKRVEIGVLRTRLSVQGSAVMLKRDLAALGLGTDSEHERDAEEYWRDLEMPRSCAAEVGAPHGRSSRPGRVCRNATYGPGFSFGKLLSTASAQAFILMGCRPC